MRMVWTKPLFPWEELDAPPLWEPCASCFMSCPTAGCWTPCEAIAVKDVTITPGRCSGESAS